MNRRARREGKGGEPQVGFGMREIVRGLWVSAVVSAVVASCARNHRAVTRQHRHDDLAVSEISLTQESGSLLVRLKLTNISTARFGIRTGGAILFEDTHPLHLAVREGPAEALQPGSTVDVDALDELVHWRTITGIQAELNPNETITRSIEFSTVQATYPELRGVSFSALIYSPEQDSGVAIRSEWINTEAN